MKRIRFRVKRAGDGLDAHAWLVGVRRGWRRWDIVEGIAPSRPAAEREAMKALDKLQGADDGEAGRLSLAGGGW